MYGMLVDYIFLSLRTVSKIVRREVDIDHHSIQQFSRCLFNYCAISMIAIGKTTIIIIEVSSKIAADSDSYIL